MKRQAAWAVVLVAVMAGSGCGMVKDFRKNRHLKAAEGYVAAKKYKEATIEYRNALRFDPQNLAAVKKLGLAYYENGQLGEAFPPLQRYHDQNQNDLEVRQKLGMIYLMGRAPDKAREEALGDPGAAAAEPRRAAAARRVGRHARGDPGRDPRGSSRTAPTLGDPDRVARALGVLYARNQDLPKAEAGVPGGRQLEARLARGAPGARAAAPRQAGARPRRRRSSRRRPTSRPRARSRGCSSPTSTC